MGHSDTVATRATVPVSDVNAAGADVASEGVGAAGVLHPPRHIWGPEEENSLVQASAGQPRGRPAVGETHSRRRDREATGLPSLTEKLFQMIEKQDRIRREEDKQRRLQDEARRVQRERDQRRLEAQERAEDIRLRERDKQQRLQENAEQRRVIEALLSSVRSISQAGPEGGQSPARSDRDPGYGPPIPE